MGSHRQCMGKSGTFEIMNMRDKYGKEILVGDVVRLHDWSTDHKDIDFTVVVWKGEYCLQRLGFDSPGIYWNENLSKIAEVMHL